MEKPELIQKLDRMLTEAASRHTYGTIEIELRAGEAVLIRQSRTELLTRERTQYGNQI